MVLNYWINSTFLFTSFYEITVKLCNVFITQSYWLCACLWLLLDLQMLCKQFISNSVLIPYTDKIPTASTAPTHTTKGDAKGRKTFLGVLRVALQDVAWSILLLFNALKASQPGDHTQQGLENSYWIGQRGVVHIRPWREVHNLIKKW